MHEIVVDFRHAPRDRRGGRPGHVVSAARPMERETRELDVEIASGILVGLALVTPFWLFVFVVSALLGVLRGMVLALIALFVGLLLLEACLAVRDKWRAWRTSRRCR